MKRIAWMGFLLAAVAAAAGADVTLTQRPDGTRVMTNSGGSRIARGLRSGGANGASAGSGWWLDRRLDLAETIARHAEQARLDPDLVHAVIQVESAYDPRALSAKGAMGLMQLMPATARELAVDDPYDVEQNVRGGTRYLRRMLAQFDQRLEWALAAYNAGPEAVSRYEGVPPYAETRAYVERVLSIYYGEERVLAGSAARRGRRVYLTRGTAGALVMTTRPPRGR